MIITDMENCRAIDKCKKCSFEQESKCMKVCPTNAIKLIDNKAFSCITCGICAKNCPNNAIKKNEFGGYYVDRIRCNGCGTCEKVCPIKILKMKKWTVKENNGIERELSYPDGICVMCGLCVEVCEHDARLYFEVNDLKSAKNRLMAERYLNIFGMATPQQQPQPQLESTTTIEKENINRMFRTSIEIDVEKCVECGKCVYVCPKNTILEKEEVDGCTGCNICKDYCPVDAIDKGIVNYDKCVLCNNCIIKCPKNALKIEDYKVIKIKEDIPTTPLKHCVNCGLCADKCPNDALKLIDGKIYYNPESCKLCNVCVKICPNEVRINKETYIEGGCVLCGICVNECPEDAIKIKELPKFEVINDDNCIGCGTCSNVCPNKAIVVKINKFKDKLSDKILREVVFNNDCVMCENCAIHCPRDVIPNTTGYKKIVNKENSFIRTDLNYCVYCGLCNKICPQQAIDKGKINLNDCEYCSACVNICPTHAISIYRDWKTEQ